MTCSLIQATLPRATQTLPSDPSVIHARLHEVEADLKVMEEQHTKIQAAASR